MVRISRTIPIAIALLVAAGLAAEGTLPSLPTAGAARAAGQPSARARSYYVRCPNLRYRGRHRLFRHAMRCSVAAGKARYVLRNHRHPPGWRCSLSNLSDGYGACARGGRAFEFLPL